MNLRVPCPCCGGQVHPIAGRCKHCKEIIAPSVGSVRAGGGKPPLLAALGVARPPVDASGAAQGTTAASLIRGWPMIAIGVATLAIAAALVLLLWPRHPDGARRGTRAPSNDRMQTSPLPDAPDPWASPPRSGSRSGLAPADPLADPPDDPDDPPDPGVDPDLDGGGDDLLGLLDPDPSDPDDLGAPQRMSNSGAMRTILSRACHKMTTCGAPPALVAQCEQAVRAIPRTALSCHSPVKLRACFRAMDQVPCSLARDGQLLLQIPPCSRLFSC